MNLFATSTEGWKVSINVEPVMQFVDTAKYYMNTYLMEFSWIHWYVIACWTLSFFVVPVRFRSLGAVLVSPLWFPFWVLAKLLTSLLAVRRANNTLALSEHYAASTAKVELLAPQIQATVDQLNDLVKNANANERNVNLQPLHAEINGLKNILSKLVAKEMSAKLDSINRNVLDGNNVVQDQFNTIRDKDREIARLNEDLRKAKDNTVKNVNVKEDKNDFEKMVQEILKSFTDKSDDHFVSLGYALPDKRFAYRLGVRLGALRNGSFNPQRDLYTVKGNGSKRLDTFLPTGLPVFSTVPVRHEVRNAVAAKPARRLMSDNEFLNRL